MAKDSWTKPYRDKWDKVKSSRVVRGTRRSARYVEGVGSGEPLFGGRLSGAFGRVLKFFLGFIIIVAFVFFIIFVVQSIRTGTAGTITERGLVAFEETGVPKVAEWGLSDTWDLIWSGGQSQLRNEFIWESEVIENEYNDDLGVNIEGFESTNPHYFSYDPIKIVGEIEAFSLKDETTLKYTCELEDYDGNVVVEPEEYLIYKDQGKEFTTVSCSFNDGFDVDKEEEREEESRTATLRVAYDFVSKAFLTVYLMDSDVLKSIKGNGQNPFDKYGIRDPHLKSDDRTQSRVTDGPINVGIGIHQSQPLSEDTPSNLKVTLTRQSIWSGHLDEVKSLRVHVPLLIELDENINFCDFRNTGMVDYHGFSIYEVTDQVLKNKVNIDCGESSFVRLAYGITSEECRRRYKDRIVLSCDFDVLDVPEYQYLFATQIHVETDYVYEDEKKEVVTVLKREIEEDLCQDLDLLACEDTVGCRPIYGQDYQLIRCETCPPGWRYCSNYPVAVCEDDPCKLGGCVLQEGQCLSA